MTRCDTPHLPYNTRPNSKFHMASPHLVRNTEDRNEPTNHRCPSICLIIQRLLRSIPFALRPTETTRQPLTRPRVPGRVYSFAAQRAYIRSSCFWGCFFVGPSPGGSGYRPAPPFANPTNGARWDENRQKSYGRGHQHSNKHRVHADIKLLALFGVRHPNHKKDLAPFFFSTSGSCFLYLVCKASV